MVCIIANKDPVLLGLCWVSHVSGYSQVSTICSPTLHALGSAILKTMHVYGSSMGVTPTNADALQS